MAMDVGGRWMTLPAGVGSHEATKKGWANTWAGGRGLKVCGFPGTRAQAVRRPK